MTISYKLYNTLTRGLETVPEGTVEPVTIYTCGPTVYNDQHIGNYRTFIFEDVLVKSLRLSGRQVKRVMNITDVGHLTSDADEGEDKLEVGARREGITAWEVAKRYEARFRDDLKELAIEEPDPLVRATDTIEAQINLIRTLEEKGYTYQTTDGVYFDTSRLSYYGTLAQLDIAGLQAGARVEVGEKRNITDFALWKFSPANVQRDMEWPSPWGTGFPGWHLECSAIIQARLGDSIDIHCGGVDHIPVHHTNEIAQSESATGKRLARIWCHGEFLLIDGGKMAKSLGNVYTLADLKERGIEPLAFRLFTYSATYRSKLNFTWEAVEAAERSLIALRRAYQEGEGETGVVPEESWQEFMTALADDLNLPRAMAVVWQVVRSARGAGEKRAFLKEADQVLSLRLDTPVQFAEETIPQEVRSLVQERTAAREARDWQKADSLREAIEAAGYQVRDTEQGVVLERLS